MEFLFLYWRSSVSARYYYYYYYVHSYRIQQSLMSAMRSRNFISQILWLVEENPLFFFQSQASIWCKYIPVVHTRIYPPPVPEITFLYLERLQWVFEENWNYRSLDIDLKKKFFQIFLCASTWNDPKILAKFSDLLFFVVATKFFCRFFLYYHVGAQLKFFLRARAAAPLKNCLNIK